MRFFYVLHRVFRFAFLLSFTLLVLSILGTFFPQIRNWGNYRLTYGAVVQEHRAGWCLTEEVLLNLVIPTLFTGFGAIFFGICAKPIQVAGRCDQCGYDLTGNQSGRCPECGTAVE